MPLLPLLLVLMICESNTDRDNFVAHHVSACEATLSIAQCAEAEGAVLPHAVDLPKHQKADLGV